MTNATEETSKCFAVWGMFEGRVYDPPTFWIFVKNQDAEKMRNNTVIDVRLKGQRLMCKVLCILPGMTPGTSRVEMELVEII